MNRWAIFTMVMLPVSQYDHLPIKAVISAPSNNHAGICVKLPMKLPEMTGGIYIQLYHSSYDLEYQRCQGFDPEPFPIITMMGIPKQHGPTQTLW